MFKYILRQILKLSIYFLEQWAAQIIGFYFFVNAIYHIPISKNLKLGSRMHVVLEDWFCYILRSSGLGVGEDMMTLLLSSILPTPLTIAISLIA